ncbi:hypothetical protein [Nitrosomonas communis]|uniref:hypothetical protein n=1 Tax=Nitrosomonas communis TaxID=44574 RepID=UPI003D2C5F33
MVTGNTIITAINIMRQKKAGKIIVAAPVVTPKTAEKLVLLQMILYACLFLLVFLVLDSFMKISTKLTMRK